MECRIFIRQMETLKYSKFEKGKSGKAPPGLRKVTMILWEYKTAIILF